MYTVTPSRQPPLRDVVYVHGGGWVHEIAPQHWALIAQLAAEARATVTVPIYRLLPDGNARQAHDLVIDVARRVIDRRGRVHLAGDSAGGQIALSVAQTLRGQGVRSLRTVLVSPALDLGFSNPRIPEVQPSDPWLGRDGGRVLGHLWADGLSIDDPDVSPLSGSFHGLGPMLVHTGTHDVLNPDAHLLVEAARAAGVDVTLRELPGALHVFPCRRRAADEQHGRRSSGPSAAPDRQRRTRPARARDGHGGGPPAVLRDAGRASRPDRQTPRWAASTSRTLVHPCGP